MGFSVISGMLDTWQTDAQRTDWYISLQSQQSPLLAEYLVSETWHSDRCLLNMILTRWATAQCQWKPYVLHLKEHLHDHFNAKFKLSFNTGYTFLALTRKGDGKIEQSSMKAWFHYADVVGVFKKSWAFQSFFGSLTWSVQPTTLTNLLAISVFKTWVLVKFIQVWSVSAYWNQAFK